MEWSAKQYLRFEDERTRPAQDLLDHVPMAEIENAIDLGCGPGNSTELIDARFPGAQISGMDMDEDMLMTARKRLPHIPFFKADLANWLPEEPVDLLYSNAVFQWIPDQLAILTRLMTTLTSGGVLAIQIPDNLGEPSHLLMEETAHAPNWTEQFGERSIRRADLPSPADYVNALGPHSSRVDVWHTHYYHQLENAAAIAEWFKGSGLRPWLNALHEEQRDDFISHYVGLLEKAYPPLDDGSVLLKFPRLFVVAIKK